MSSYYVNKKTKLSRGVKNVLIDYSENTTAHGLPRIGKAQTSKARIFWLVVCIICTFAFIWLAIQLVARYLRFEKITQIEITSYDQFRAAAAAAKAASAAIVSSDSDSDQAESSKTRRKRIPITYEYRYKPVYAFCRCKGDDGALECLPFFDAKARDGDSQCLCFYDPLTESPFRCFPVAYWSLRWCTRCELAGNCPPADVGKLEAEAAGNADDAYKYIAPCVCQNVTEYCIATGDKPFGRLWTIPRKPTAPPLTPFQTRAPTTTTTIPEIPEPTDTQQMGFDLEKSKEESTKMNIQGEIYTFKVAALSDEDKKKIFYKKEEFVISCTFNQQDCDMVNDFKVYEDPKYGNCFIFNHNATQNKTSKRAGPMYGLTILLFINESDYLNNTFGRGVRLSIQAQEDTPFPDTFGYNAPTGFLSSFGIRKKSVHRMKWPKDDCFESDQRPSNELNMYENDSYSLEGCFRTCYQAFIIKNCSCSDPSFGTIGNTPKCKFNDSNERECVVKRKKELGGLHGDFSSQCPQCIQPCNQTVYDVAFSMASWPHVNALDSYSKHCGNETDRLKCDDYLSRNMVYLEIYYEQLNYENLTESQAYMLANLLADLGGQLGLWLGFSVITCWEFIFLIYDLCRLCYHVERDKRKAKKKEHQDSNGELFDNDTVTMTLKIGGAGDRGSSCQPDTGRDEEAIMVENAELQNEENEEYDGDNVERLLKTNYDDYTDNDDKDDDSDVNNADFTINLDPTTTSAKTNNNSENKNKSNSNDVDFVIDFTPAFKH